MMEPHENTSIRAHSGNILVMLLYAAAAICSIITALGFLGRFAWFLDLLAHFRVQYFVVFGAIALLTAVIRQFKFLAWFALLAIINFLTFLPLYFGGSGNPSENSYRAILANVHTQNRNTSLVADFIRKYNPDIIVLEEVNENWIQELKATTDSYEFKEICPREDNFGIALFSKFPLDESKVIYIGTAHVPSITAEIKTPRGILHIIATHPVPPIGSRYWALRNEQLAAIPSLVKNSKNPVLLLGDFNTSPWSYYFRRLIKESGLRDSSRGYGVQPTWPSYNPLLRVPIDHCLYSPAIQILHREVGPNIGSDHFPVIIDFALPTN